MLFLATGSSRFMALWPRNPEAMEVSMAGSTMFVLGMVTAFVVVLLGFFGVWQRIKGDVRKNLEAEARKRVMADMQVAPPVINRVDEEPIPQGKALLDFWQGVHRSNHWRTLSHVYQADTRNYLREAKDAAAAGNQAGALFWAGKAHEAAFNAVKPEAQIARGIKAMVEAEKQKLQAESEPETAGARPGDRWGDQ